MGKQTRYTITSVGIVIRPRLSVLESAGAMMTLPMVQTLRKRAREEEKYYKSKDDRVVLPAHSRGPDGHESNISAAIGQAGNPSGRRVPEAGTARVFDPSNFELYKGRHYPKTSDDNENELINRSNSLEDVRDYAMKALRANSVQDGCSLEYVPYHSIHDYLCTLLAVGQSYQESDCKFTLATEGMSYRQLVATALCLLPHGYALGIHNNSPPLAAMLAASAGRRVSESAAAGRRASESIRTTVHPPK